VSDESEEKLAKEVAKLSELVQGLLIEIRGWRTHTGSTGYFLQVAVEDLHKAVDKLEEAVKE
jgi:hypothetical protein